MPVVNLAYHRAWRQANREKVNAYTAVWRKKNPGRQRAATRKWYYLHLRHEFGRGLWRNYKLTLEQYDALLLTQAGRCKICDDNPRCLHVDHIRGEHGVTSVRGLLCRACNMAIGAMYHDPVRLHNAAEYLEDKSCST